MLTKIESAADPQMLGGEPLELHSFEPWLIIKSRPNQEAKAKETLMREGFEVYYGARIKFVKVTIPAKKISSKNRHRRRSEYHTIERASPIYPGYLFIRRLWGALDLYRAFDLPGVLGLCCFDERPATIEDYKIELLRLWEARGKFDEQSLSTTPHDVRAAERQRGAPAKDKSKRRTLKRIDESDCSVLFVEELGRITRIITSHGAAPSGRSDGVPPQVRSFKGLW